MRVGLRGPLALAWLFAMAASCSGDSRPRDAGSDAGSDGGSDAGYDASRPRDAGQDATADAGEPGSWIQLPGLPDGCVVQYTTDASLFEGFSREPCPDREGCELLVPNWGTGLIDLRVEGGHSGPEGSIFHFVRTTPPSHWERWVSRSDGSVLLGLRSRSPLDLRCRHSAFGFDLERFASIVIEPDGEGFVHSWVFAGQLSDARSIQSFGRLSDALPRGSDFHRTRVGASRIGLESAPWSSITDLTWTGEATRVGDSRDGGETYLSAVVDDTLIYNVYGRPHHIRAAIAGAPGEVLIAPADAEANNVMTDGTDIAWIQGYERDGLRFGRLELWASPYANRAADIEPRRVAAVSETRISLDAAIGSGYVALVEWTGERTELGVFRLSDGARATVEQPADRGFWNSAAFIGPETLGIAVGLRGSPPRDESMMIIRLDSLDFVVP